MLPPYPAYDPTDRGCFSFETVSRRWPVILTTVIDKVYRTNHDLASTQATPRDAAEQGIVDEQIIEGKEIIRLASKLKHEMGHDHALKPIEYDGGEDLELYNSRLKLLEDKQINTWFTAPWLYAECYLYRLFRSWFTRTKHWTQYDPFLSQKTETFKSSGAAVFQLALIMTEVDETHDVLDQGKIQILFEEMVHMCLWGNATDLSLLPSMSYADIQALQSVGKAAQASNAKFILRNDTEALWNHISTVTNGQVDIILDNSGFELFTDLVFADFLVTHTPFVSKVVFHPKSIPWFVSDVTPPDFYSMLSGILSKSSCASYFESCSPSPETVQALDAMSRRWQTHVSSGKFVLSTGTDSTLGTTKGGVGFWTLPSSYWELPEQLDLMHQLQKSDLVIFKGDLNYRKLTADCRWPASTPFADALGPLRGCFPLLSLRTNKADVVVGVERELADRMDREVQGWRVNGKYALISFEGKGGRVE